MKFIKFIRVAVLIGIWFVAVFSVFRLGFVFYENVFTDTAYVYCDNWQNSGGEVWNNRLRIEKDQSTCDDIEYFTKSKEQATKEANQYRESYIKWCDTKTDQDFDEFMKCEEFKN